MNQSRENSTARKARMARIRTEIEAGNYDTPARLSAAVDRLLDEILPADFCEPDPAARKDSKDRTPRRRPK